MLGGGAGSIQDMINRYRDNRKMLRKKNPFKKERSFLNGQSELIRGTKRKLKIIPATREQLARVRRKVFRERKKYTYTAFSILLIIIISSIYLAFNLSKSNSKFDQELQVYEKEKQDKELQKKWDKYFYYIKEGDNWLKQRDWHNAIFQYKLAYELFPTNYDANYRLTIAYAKRCKFESKDCEKAEEMIDKLLKLNPKDQKIIEIRDFYLKEFLKESHKK